MRIGLGKHVAKRKNEVVQVPMIVELALIPIKKGFRALRFSVQILAHPLRAKFLQQKEVNDLFQLWQLFQL